MGGTFVLTSLSLIFGGVCMLLMGAGGIPPSGGGQCSPWSSNVFHYVCHRGQSGIIMKYKYRSQGLRLLHFSPLW